jgi:hypothetical protein
MIYIYVQWDKQGVYEPHITFKNSEKEYAKLEIQDLKDSGHRAKTGPKFPKTV